MHKVPVELWKWRGVLILGFLVLMLWAIQNLVLSFIRGTPGLALLPIFLIAAFEGGALYAKWAQKSSSFTDYTQNAFLGWLEMPLRRWSANRQPRPAEAWFRWALESSYPDQALAFLHEAVNMGHADALFEMGLYLAEGRMSQIGKVEARDYFRRAAEQGHSEAAFHYAETIRWGLGAPRDAREAHGWYLRSAQAGFAPAMEWLAAAFETGEGVEPEAAQAADWKARRERLEVAPGLRRSALGQIRSEERELGHRWKRELKSAWQDFFEALAASSIFPYLALAGGLLVFALFALYAYAWGLTMLATPVWAPVFAILGVVLVGMGWLAISTRRRMRYSRRGRRQDQAARSGDAEACFRLGMDFLRGTPERPRDPVTAKRWLRQAAEGGHVEAMFQLGDLLSWTIAGPKEPLGAEKWITRAAEAGHAAARARLERMHPPVDAKE